MFVFGKIIGAMVTPFNELGNIDYEVVKELLLRYEKEGHEAIVLSGSTGENSSLTMGEKIDLLTFCRQNTRLKLIMGIHANSTNFAIEEIKTIKEYRPDGLLIVVPYYNKPPQGGIFLHFKKCSQAAGTTPVIIYNVPSRTGVNIEFQTIRKLAKSCKNIIGIKEASSDYSLMSLIKQNLPDFLVYSGNDAGFMKALKCGADGIISVSSIIYGKDYNTLIDDLKHGYENHLLSEYLDVVAGLLSVEVNPIPIKYLLSLHKFSSMNLRLPLIDISYEGRKCIDLIKPAGNED